MPIYNSKTREYPRSSIDVDPTQFQKPKKTFAFDEIAREVRGYAEKGYGLNFINENYATFIEDYIELANKPFFSYALLSELKERYLFRLHDKMYREFRSKARYAFYSEGPTWTIVFDGKTLRGLRGKGFKYLHHLVCNKNKRIYPSELVQLDSFSINDFKGTDKIISAPIDSEDGDKKRKIDFYQIIKSDIPIEVADERFREDLKKEKDRLRKEVKEATEKNDLDRKEKAIIELKTFSFFWAEYFGKKRKGEKEKIRIFKDATKKTKDRIAVNINRALERIKQENPKASKHIKDALGSLYSTKLSYRPSKDIDWQT